ncbi:MAG: hypothetical protein RL220_2117, partial [Bacteroidota bacterium]
WEYRGPNTVPDNTVCSQGSCGAGSVPISSLTTDNGFVIFDSNYWDDDDGVCGGLGTGQDPAPHTNSLITGTLDFSSAATVVLTFQQQFKHFQASTKVFVSNDNGINWTEILNNSGVFSPSSEWKTVNITTQAAGQNDVKIKFQFSGTYYWWLLDDIAFYSPNPNDLQLGNPAYALYGVVASPILFDDMMYHAYPQIMVPPQTFTGKGTNIGGNAQTQVRLYVDVRKNGTQTTYTNNTAAVTIQPGQTTNFQLPGTYTNTSGLGTYQVLYNLDQLQTDDNVSNNLDTLDYLITEYTYARDEFSLADVFTPQPQYSGQPMEIGNVFQARASGPKATSMQVVLGEGTTVGSQIYGIVYNLDRTITYATTQPYTVNLADINEAGGNYAVTLDFISPITLADDTIYLAMVGNYGGNDQLRVGRSGPAPAEASLVRYPAVNGLFYMFSAPMVRLSIFPADAIPGCTNPSAQNYDASATTDDGSCQIAGCTIAGSFNYNPLANWDDGSCLYCGCNDPEADNYDPGAGCDDGSCIFSGCTDPTADNYDPQANQDDGSCFNNGCMNPDADNYDPLATVDDGSCIISGCTNAEAANYDPEANLDDGSCVFPGCTNPLADNYDPQANQEDGSCILSGCTDPEADNYWADANNDDGSCFYLGCMDPEADNYDPTATIDDGNCIYYGCTDPGANNYDPGANTDDLSCLYETAALAVDILSGCAPLEITLVNQTAVQEGGTCLFTMNGVSFGDGCFASQDFILEEPGEYYFYFQYAQGESVTETTLGPVTVYPVPAVPELTVNSTDLQISCAGCENMSTLWTIDDISTNISGSVISIPEISAGVADNGYYAVQITDENGCSSISGPELVLIPVASLTTDSICSPADATLINLTDPVEGIAIQVDFGDGTEDLTWATEYFHTYENGGNYSWSLNVTAGNMSAGIGGNVLVIQTPPVPMIEAHINSGYFVCANSDEADDIIWLWAGEEINSDSVEFVSGYTTAILINGGVCTSSASIEWQSVDDTFGQVIRLMPNPAHHEAWLTGIHEDTGITIFDGQGRRCFCDYVRTTDGYMIDTTLLPNGTYYIRLEHRDRLITVPLVVLK